VPPPRKWNNRRRCGPGAARPGGVPERPIGTALKAVAGSDVSRGFKSRLLRQWVTRYETTGEAGFVASADETRYRWSRAYGLRIFGATVIVLAALWVLSALLGFPSWSLALLCAVGLLAILCLLRLVAFPLPLLELSGGGYRLRNMRGGGVQSAPWSEVDSVASEGSPTGAILVITLTGGRSTVVPLGMLGAEAAAAEREFHGRLNTAFGYRRLGGS